MLVFLQNCCIYLIKLGGCFDLENSHSMCLPCPRDPQSILIVYHTGGKLDLVFCVSAYLWLLSRRSTEPSLSATHLLGVPHVYVRTSVAFDTLLFGLPALALFSVPNHTTEGAYTTNSNKGSYTTNRVNRVQQFAFV